jgi:hypothetical protein
MNPNAIFKIIKLYNPLIKSLLSNNIYIFPGTLSFRLGAY